MVEPGEITIAKMHKYANYLKYVKYTKLYEHFLGGTCETALAGNPVNGWLVTLWRLKNV